MFAGGVEDRRGAESKVVSWGGRLGVELRDAQRGRARAPASEFDDPRESWTH